MVTALHCCVVLKIVVANRPVQNHLQGLEDPTTWRQRKRERTIRLTGKTTILHVHYTLLYTSLPFYGGHVGGQYNKHIFVEFTWKGRFVPRGEKCFCSWSPSRPPWRHVYTRLRVVPHFSSGIVGRAKPERAWTSPHAPPRVAFSRVGWFSRALAFRSPYYPWGKMGDYS